MELQKCVHKILLKKKIPPYFNERESKCVETLSSVSSAIQSILYTSSSIYISNQTAFSREIEVCSYDNAKDRLLHLWPIWHNPMITLQYLNVGRSPSIYQTVKSFAYLPLALSQRALYFCPHIKPISLLNVPSSFYAILAICLQIIILCSETLCISIRFPGKALK